MACIISVIGAPGDRPCWAMSHIFPPPLHPIFSPSLFHTLFCFLLPVYLSIYLSFLPVSLSVLSLSLTRPFTLNPPLFLSCLYVSPTHPFTHNISSVFFSPSLTFSSILQLTHFLPSACRSLSPSTFICLSATLNSFSLFVGVLSAPLLTLFISHLSFAQSLTLEFHFPPPPFFFYLHIKNI